MGIKNQWSQYVNKLVIENKSRLGKYQTSEGYWTRHNVTLHHQFNNTDESYRYFEWRSMQYLGYLELMPVDKADGKVVLDYGCGPGHDLVGFVSRSKPKKLIGMDVSPSSINEAKARLSLHEGDVDFMLIDENFARLPLEDNSIDIIHTSGVLHHIADLGKVLRELARVLSDTGYMQVMVYNYDSIWMHLFTHYIQQIKNKTLANLDKREAFSKFTDGYACPIANCYKKEEFISLVQSFGLKCEFAGAAISTLEMKILNERFAALEAIELDSESREFLYSITFDNLGRPLYKGNVAGQDACYRISKP